MNKYIIAVIVSAVVAVCTPKVTNTQSKISLDQVRTDRVIVHPTPLLARGAWFVEMVL